MDNSDLEEEKYVTQMLELAKGDLQQRIEKEVRGNVELQASLERTKQLLHKRHLEYEQEVLNLQDELQAEKGLKAALEVQDEK